MRHQYLEKSDVLNNSQISKLHGIDYEFILLSEDLTKIKHLKNNVFLPLMVNLICTERSFVKWTHRFLPSCFALNIIQMNSKNPELDGTIYHPFIL